jgi:signal transduction histidine kinase
VLAANRTGEGMENEIKRYIIAAWLLLVVAISVFIIAIVVRQDRLIRQQSRDEAYALFESVALSRNWNSEHGGVYVYKRAGVVSNPYLENPGIKDDDNSTVTLPNTKNMSHEISELASEGGKFIFHITSLKYKYPDNAPDEWETKALREFENGVDEVSGDVEIGGKRYFRLMRPILYEPSCIGCHQGQGYKVGDVRGGISVTMPDDVNHREMRRNAIGLASAGLVLVAILIFVLYYFVWRLMDRLARQKAELVVLNDAKDKFLGMAAHDLRSPLTVVFGYTELLEDMVPEGRKNELVEGINNSVTKMLGLINDLLDISKIRSGKLDLNREDVQVAPFVRDCATISEILCGNKGIKLRLTLPDENLAARFDRSRMHQVIDNLMANACKFSNAGSEVELGARSSAGSLEIWVEDHGIGISPDELGLVFDEFRMVSSRPTGGESSHGLGLAIVKKLVELHGGTVVVDSRLGEGTKFTITLPLT